MNAMRWARWVVLAGMLVSCGLSTGAAIPTAWTNAMEPFHIAGNLYYVGSEDLASYLGVTPKGLILINSNLASSPTQIKALMRGEAGISFWGCKDFAAQSATHTLRSLRGERRRSSS